MGPCLYLALMKQTFGKDFTLCVLDDVLMSVDAGHRREISRLLKAEFPTLSSLSQHMTASGYASWPTTL